jgi:hypothetical protein
MKFVYKNYIYKYIKSLLTNYQMQSLLTDVILFLSNNYLEKDKDKLSFLSCVTSWHTLKSKIHFQREVNYNQQLESLFYYKNLNIRFVMYDNNFKSIPKYTKLLYLNNSFFQSLKKGYIPNSVTTLELSCHFNQPLKKGDIPDSVTTLILGFHFNHPLKKGDIPNSVTTLKFGYHFNQPLKKGDIPNSLTNLVFGWEFDQPLKKGDIPNSVTDLGFGGRFNQPLKKGDIPNSVVTLRFGNDFNQPLSSAVIPNSVKEIFLNKWFYTLPIPDSVLNRVTTYK